MEDQETGDDVQAAASYHYAVCDAGDYQGPQRATKKEARSDAASHHGPNHCVSIVTCTPRDRSETREAYDASDS